MVVCVIAAALATRMIDVDVRDEVLMAVMRSRRLLLESCQTKLMLSKKTTEIEVEMETAAMKTETLCSPER